MFHAPLSGLRAGDDNPNQNFSLQYEQIPSKKQKKGSCILNFSVNIGSQNMEQILDTNPSLHFSLLRLQLIELIRNCTSDPDGDISAALAFATTHLAPRAPSNPAFLQDLERTMALLCFPPQNLAPPLAELMDPALRKQVATKVNEAILDAQGVPKEAKIRRLVRLRAWAEQRIRNEKRDIPPMDLGLDLGQPVDEPMGA